MAIMTAMTITTGTTIMRMTITTGTTIMMMMTAAGTGSARSDDNHCGNPCLMA